MKKDRYIIVHAEYFSNNNIRIVSFVKTNSFFSDYYTKPTDATNGDIYYFKFIAHLKKYTLEKRHGKIFKILTFTN